MKIIGLTGGIGSGKSTIAKVFSLFGAKCFESDKVANQITQNSQEVKNQIINLLGVDAYLDGIYNRKYVSGKVFNNPFLLKELENIIHPKVNEAFHKFILENKNQKFVVLESAILFKSGFNKFCDFVVLCTANQEVRINRVILRDNSDRKKVMSRIISQNDDEQIKPFCKYIIENNDDKSLILQVEDLLKSEE